MDFTKLSKEDLLKLLDSIPANVVEEAASTLQLPPSPVEQLAVELIHIMLCQKKTDCLFMMEMQMDTRWEQEEHLEWREKSREMLESYGLSYEDISDNYDLIIQMIQLLKERPIVFDIIRLIKDCDEASGFISDPAHKIKIAGE